MNQIEFNDGSDRKVLRPDERLSRIVWPELYRVQVPHVKPNDCLLLCAGFEDRSLSVVKRLQSFGITGVSVGIVRYLPKQAENRLQELRSICRNSGFNITEFVYDRENPSGMGESLQAFAESFMHVFLDISGMSRLLIVQVLVALNSSQRDVSVLYGEAEKYAPTEKKFYHDGSSVPAKFRPTYLSSGVFEIAATPELGSTSMLGEAIRLVAFPSFDPTQLAILVQELQPTYAEIIHGISPRQHNAWRTRAIRDLNRQALNEIQWKREHNASTLDYREILRILLTIYAERSAFDRLVIAPIGSKMQAVAVGLLRSALRDVQIVYPTPQFFSAPEEYTSGFLQLYQLDFPSDIFSNTI